ncbi:MAG: AMP-binding protein, partial [Acidobacteriota bacterium]
MPRRPLTLDALFARSVHDHGSAVAVLDGPDPDGPARGRQAWSYAGLDAYAETVARELEARGIGRGDAVAIHAGRTVRAVAAILAAARIGAVFVPVGLDTPPARLVRVLEDAGARLLLADAAGAQRLDRLEREPGEAHRAPGLPAPVVPIAGPPARPTRPGRPGRTDRPGRTVREDDAAYIIYTSGTTGRPKGVVVEQGSIARRFHDFDERYRLSGRSCRV